MEKTIFEKATYDYEPLRERIFSLLTIMDKERIAKGTRVLIKPNLLAPSTVEQAMVTHPLVIRAAAEYALSRGADVRVSDSNAVGAFSRLVSKCGLSDALNDLEVELRPFRESVPVKTDGFGTLELSRAAMEADIIINLPKLKTHSQMGLTMAVKNLFGCIVGFRKPEWHYRVGEDKDRFAQLLVTIYSIIKPSINLMDGILAMEGQGPGANGIPREMGILAASTDALSLDMAACRLVGIKPMDLLTVRAAHRMGLVDGEPETLNMPQATNDFNIPDTGDLLFGPGFARGFLRRNVASRPKNVEGLCKYCDECVKICPAGAVINPGGRLDFDYHKCIRCYCCVEVCPHGAMEKRDTWVKKLLSTFFARGR